ncbi:Hypp470 [Branchiostoma lanceolatum]|uniref:Hypp470 protein n=1 Tax=Branchiostoma lanceolatum TaxID=7740 RepID=A0A8J9VZS3_BRALA|nr:Hypp470 [Branchiostoma lanceolatum]
MGSESDGYTYTSLGCWKDTSNRAIPTLEGTDPSLNENYWERLNPIDKCYLVALSHGFPMFAVQDSGECFGSADGLNTYQKYGPSMACAADGEGGDWANDVYQITETPVVPIVAGVVSVLALCAIGAGMAFYLIRRRRSQATTQDVYVDRPERAAEEANTLKKDYDPSAKPRDSHIYDAINLQNMDNNLTGNTEKPGGINIRPDRRHNKTNHATPDDLRGTISEHIPDEIPEESPYQALNPDTMENAQYTSLSELAKRE